MKNRVSLWLLIACFHVLFLTGCTTIDTIHHDYTFTGESENWTAELKVDAKETFYEKGNHITKYESEQNRMFTLTYKGELSEIANIKNIAYSYKAGSRETAIQKKVPSPLTQKVFTMQSHGKDVSIIRKDEVIQASVTIDGVTENMELQITD